ncbi:hypothetical protein L226DRAFT_233223 [Lentinus tigrinus ALCF2SS1-7]|uniref:uncharacterized protein n=1 Tax=Lentinus tigrinus ALCF2SS1-7 TaxID=1328758 RepID=UPI00116627D9|nr:hypothetical protein L226DRAFT_233223 [Lentinus tigrinus ALCF2SS1-7]
MVDRRAASAASLYPFRQRPPATCFTSADSANMSRLPNLPRDARRCLWSGSFGDTCRHLASWRGSWRRVLAPQLNNRPSGAYAHM